MATTYWYKEIVSAPVVVAGAAVKWEALDGNRGVLIVNDETHPALAAGLKKLADERRGGVVQITQQQYEDKKKALPFNPLKASARRQGNMLRAYPNNPDPLRKEASVAAVKPIRRDQLPAQVTEVPAGQTPAHPFQPATAKVERKTGKLAAAMQQTLQK